MSEGVAVKNVLGRDRPENKINCQFYDSSATEAALRTFSVQLFARSAGFDSLHV